ncbi:hypothetical protein BGZ61DRAFT_516337 [Ilyonectria robusta]|uniref:uncharacterized protein n=1 Tax=Ilyonectria robusta TaxID=1079257 RepID=UPI001E8D41DA|nr:uncharacterized protein BGZ61DRAFT_516337 [Ilyonectria robusta]KAH8722236.1 hypothetical protein BGZ61DRAFT_516337 [Ilyonectria robusta]
MKRRAEGDKFEDRVEEWQRNLPAAPLPDDLGIAARVYLACSKLYKSILQRLVSRADIGKPLYRNIERSFSTLVLWAKTHEAPNGTLDRALLQSSDLRALTLGFLVDISQILTQRLVGASGLLLDDGITLLSKTTHDLAREGLRLILTDDQDEYNAENSYNSPPEDSLERIASNLRSNVECLVDLGPLIEDLQVEEPGIIDNRPEPETFHLSCHEALSYCGMIRDRFRKLPLTLVERLGEANAQRAAMIQERRDAPQMKDEQIIEDIEESLFSESAPRFTATTKSTLNSGSVFDSASINQTAPNDTASRATFASFSTTLSTIDRGLPRIPPLPEGASEGKPFDCLTCSNQLNGITSRPAWKEHIFEDLSPYVCTIENCDQSSVLFKSSYIWSIHEASHQFLSGDCPFCTTRMTERNSDYYRHVSRHLREISLAALPRTLATLDEDTDSSSTSAIVPTVQTQSSSKKASPAAIEESALGHRLDAEAPTRSNVLMDKDFVKPPNLEAISTPSIDAFIPRLSSEDQTPAASRSAIPEMSVLETSQSPTPGVNNESMKESSDRNSQPLLSSRTSRRGQTQTRSLSLACPFFKRDPKEHGGCVSKRLTRIRDVKQHLSRIHAPRFYCQRCFFVFDKEYSHQEHVTNANCTHDPSAHLMRVSYDQLRELSRKSKPSLSETDQWFAIWDILFPGEVKPDSVFIDPSLSVEMSIFRECYQGLGVAMLRSELLSSEAFLSSTPEAERESRLSEIISRDMRNFYDNWRTIDDKVTRMTTVEAPEVQASEGHLVDNSSVSKSQELLSEPPGHGFSDAERDADFWTLLAQNQDGTPLPNMTTFTPSVTGDIQPGSSIQTIGDDGNHEERAGYGGAHSVDTLLDFSRGLGDNFELDKSLFDDPFGELDK